MEGVHVPGLLRVRVSDDGTGGARLEARGGLAGFAERAKTVDSGLRISGPPAGPGRQEPVIRADLPCGETGQRLPYLAHTVFIQASWLGVPLEQDIGRRVVPGKTVAGAGDAVTCPEFRRRSSQVGAERIQGVVKGNITDGDVAELIRSTAEATAAYIRGDIHRYLALIKHADDYTLMPPYGGEPKRGFDAKAALENAPKMFRGGEADQELVASYASGDMAVLVAVERQHGEVGGMPGQDWSLRVTWVFRREGPEWRLVHRHADPLVHAISMEQMAALARGQT